VLYYLVYPRFYLLHPWVTIVLAAGMVIFFLVPFLGLVMITVTSLSGLDLLFPRSSTATTMKVLFPIAATLAQLLGIERNRRGQTSHGAARGDG